jgi:hypothetical protein
LFGARDGFRGTVARELLSGPVLRVWLRLRREDKRCSSKHLELARPPAPFPAIPHGNAILKSSRFKPREEHEGQPAPHVFVLIGFCGQKFSPRPGCGIFFTVYQEKGPTKLAWLIANAKEFSHRWAALGLLYSYNAVQIGGCTVKSNFLSRSLLGLCMTSVE